MTQAVASNAEAKQKYTQKLYSYEVGIYMSYS